MPSAFAHCSLLCYPNHLILLVHYLLLFYSCLLSSLLLLLPTCLFLMEREDSAPALFKRARARGCEKSKGIINGEEVRGTAADNEGRLSSVAEALAVVS